MRIRAVAAIVLLLIPAGLDAQRRLRLPRIGRRPAAPTPIPQQPPTVAKALAYKRLRVSVEGYSLVSYVESPAIAGGGAAFRSTSFGAGTRTDYRMTRYLSATLDMTSAFLAGSSETETIEIGTRLRPERRDRRLYPFVDVRAGYVHEYDDSFGDFVVGPVNGQAGYGSRLGRGFGLVGGGGLEIGLTRSLSVTTAATVMRSHMTAYSYRGTRPTDDKYSMTSYRYVLGIRWNPVRLIRKPGTE